MKKKRARIRKPENLTLYGSGSFLGSIVTDPFGSYTGRGNHPEELPVQDVDDL